MKNLHLLTAGYIKRHVEAIKKYKSRLDYDIDPNDIVGYIDSYFPDTSYFGNCRQIGN